MPSKPGRVRARRIGVAEAKASLSELLGRVNYLQERFVIVKRGRPVAQLIPAPQKPVGSLADVQGWLDADDPFFEIMADIESGRYYSAPRRPRKA
jgi:prevent-host-death family protein